MPQVRIGLLGLGTVGQAVVQLNQPFAGNHYEITRAVVRNSDKVRTVSVPLSRDPLEVIDDPAIDVVVEVVGGRPLARDWILRALANGKAVVTANKEVMAYHGSELIKASHEASSYLGYEASVCGGIPILDAIRWHLSAAPIQKIYGVLNGTTNYLLCAMAEERSLAAALQEARDAGYAEVDSTADIRGEDAARKLVLLAYLAFGRWIHPEQLLIEGLQEWPRALFSRLNRADLVIRLLGAAERFPDGRIKAQVRPTLVRRSSPLFHLRGVQNGIGLQTAAGHYWMQGPGAGGLATASSIWSDIRKSSAITRIPDPDIAPAADVFCDSLALPFLDAAIDPDRRLDTMTSHAHFGDPSLAYSPYTSPASEGVLRFPLWE